jgi:cob(I)alamin adenosyltransferase
MTHDPKQAPEPRQAGKRKGLVIVHTGDGKGKTTAALGIMMRAWGHGMRVCVIQFIKKEGARVGEQRAAEKMGIEFLSSGDGFTWRSRDLDESAARARHGWQMAQERIASGQYDIIILDEMTYPLNYGWLDLDEVLEWLRAKPPMLHLVITGRDAPQALIDYADLVTEMRLVKHPYDEQGIKAQPGIEF